MALVNLPRGRLMESCFRVMLQTRGVKLGEMDAGTAAAIVESMKEAYALGESRTAPANETGR